MSVVYPCAAAVANEPEASGGKRWRFRRRVLLPLLLLLGLAVALKGLARAWRDTTLREAFLPQLEARARQDPYDGRLLALLGARLAEAGEYAAAADALQRAVAAGERDAAVWLTWAAAVAAAGNADRSKAVLRLGMSNSRLTPKLRPALERSLQLGPAPSPEALAESLCPQGPRLLVSSRTRGSFLNRLVEWWGRRHPERSGFATRERWAREQPKNVRVQRLWAEALMRNRRLPEAEKVARHILTLTPNSPEAHLLLGDILARQGAVAKAGLEFVAALRLRPNWLPALLRLGDVALKKKLLTMGVDVFERATRQHPQSADAWIGLGRAYYNQRLNLSKSLQAFQQAARLAPQRTDYFASYAEALQANFRYAEAERRLRQRLAVAPHDAQCHYMLALLLLDYQPTPARAAEAEKALRTSLRLQPHVAAVEAHLGDLLLRQGKPEEAVTLLESALEGDPRSVMAMMALVRAYRQMGRKQEAKEAQQKLDWLSQYAARVASLEDRAQREPLNAQLHRELAQLYASGGEREKAERASEMAYVLQTRPKEAQRGIGMLDAATTAVLGEAEGEGRKAKKP